MTVMWPVFGVVLMAWGYVHCTIMRERGCVHKDSAYRVGDTLYVSPEAYELLRAKAVARGWMAMMNFGMRVVATELCRPRTGW